MAYVRKRLDAWEVSINKKGFLRQSRTFSTKSDADKWARHVENEMDRGIFVSRKEAENTTLSEAIDRYEREVTPLKKGISQELSRLRILKASSLSSRTLASIQGKDIATYRDKRLKEVSDATLRRELTILSAIFKYVIKECGMTGLTNPVEAIRLPSARGEIRDRRLYPGELDRICEASESPILPHISRLAIETGMRQAEIAGMTWELMDLKKRTVTLLDTKNGEKRLVPLSMEAVRILSGLTRRIDGKVWGVQSHSISVAWRRAVSRARAVYEEECQAKGENSDQSFLIDLTFHDLRHEATSRFFEKGFNPMEVSTITGHKTLQMLKRYTHLRAENLAKRLK